MTEDPVTYDADEALTDWQKATVVYVQNAMSRITTLENKLEVLAAMVETPPPPVFTELTSVSCDCADRIEALELRQNLVESPVMLRIATAVEELANHFCAWDSVGEDRREFESRMP